MYYAISVPLIMTENMTSSHLKASKITFDILVDITLHTENIFF